MPAIIAKPPDPVTAKAIRAPRRPSGRCFQKPIKRNDDSEVSSQNTSKSKMLSDRTIPSMAP